MKSSIIDLRYFGKRWVPNPKQWAVHKRIHELEERFPMAYVGMIGAARSSKTVLLINELVDHCLRFPGYPALLSRWTDDATQKILKPAFYDIANNHYAPEILGEWVAREERQMFANGSSVIISGLKSGDDTNRYAAFDGLSLAGVYISQAEELPKDTFERLKTRLSFPGPPRLMLFEMNPVLQNHYLFREFEPREGYRVPEDHALYHLSVYDNAENLAEGYIDSLEAQYPPGHPLRHRLIEGKWGMTAKGDPVIGPGLFSLDLHVAEVEFDPLYPLILSYDPGFKHPCLVWAQMDSDYRLNVLDVMLGVDVSAEEFFWQAAGRQRQTFGPVKHVLACADKASEQRTSATTKTAWDIFHEYLKPWEITPLTGVVSSKDFLIQRHMARYGRLVKGTPAIRFHPRCEYLIEAASGGWVWRAPTDLRPTPSIPLDSYYSHGMDCLLYVEMHFGPGIRRVEQIKSRVEQPRARRRATAAGY